MKLPHTEVKFYPEVKSQNVLSSLRVSCKRALRYFSTTLSKYLDYKCILHEQNIKRRAQKLSFLFNFSSFSNGILISILSFERCFISLSLSCDGEFEL